jgi:hypothetical protein
MEGRRSRFARCTHLRIEIWGTRFRGSQEEEDYNSEGYEGDGDEGGGVEDLIVRGVAGVVEEEVVLDAHVGDDGHGDLDVAAFVGGWEDVEGG